MTSSARASSRATRRPSERLTIRNRGRQAATRERAHGNELDACRRHPSPDEVTPHAAPYVATAIGDTRPTRWKSGRLHRVRDRAQRRRREIETPRQTVSWSAPTRSSRHHFDDKRTPPFGDRPPARRPRKTGGRRRRAVRVRLSAEIAEAIIARRDPAAEHGRPHEVQTPRAASSLHRRLRGSPEWSSTRRPLVYTKPTLRQRKARRRAARAAPESVADYIADIGKTSARLDPLAPRSPAPRTAHPGDTAVAPRAVHVGRRGLEWGGPAWQARPKEPLRS